MLLRGRFTRSTYRVWEVRCIGNSLRNWEASTLNFEAYGKTRVRKGKFGRRYIVPFRVNTSFQREALHFTSPSRGGYFNVSELPFRGDALLQFMTMKIPIVRNLSSYISCHCFTKILNCEFTKPTTYFFLNINDFKVLGAKRVLKFYKSPNLIFGGN